MTLPAIGFSPFFIVTGVAPAVSLSALAAPGTAARFRVALCSISLLALAAVAHAAPPTPPHRSTYKPALILQWKDRLQGANRRLQQGQWRKGRDVADSVLREMRDRIASGEASGDLLAVALLFRAIGEAGLGDSETAAWDFGVAQAFYPSYAKVDLKPYGTAGELLEQWRYVDGVPVGLRETVPLRDPAERTVTPPRKLSGAPAEYPLAKAASCTQDSVVVRTIIDVRGQPVSPSLPIQVDPVLALAAFDAVRQWRFEPARQEGQPVPVSFLLTVDFKRFGC
jgi:hypothetical protein